MHVNATNIPALHSALSFFVLQFREEIVYGLLP